jgi:hypothetical protein
LVRVTTIFAAIALLFVVLIATVVGLNLILPKLQQIVNSSTITSNNPNSSSTSPLVSSSSSLPSTLSGNFTVQVVSVRVTPVAFNSSTGAEIFNSTVTIQFPDNGKTIDYTFSVVPWNLTLMQGTKNLVTFGNGKLVGLQPDANGIIQEHTHILLHMIINGVTQNVPSGMGIFGGTKANTPSQYIDSGIIGPIHTHDTSNIIHFEISVPNYHFTLGDMFSEWGYSFNSSCLWGHCASNARVQVYINSTTPYNGPDPQSLDVPDNVPANSPTNVTIVWTS